MKLNFVFSSPSSLLASAPLERGYHRYVIEIDHEAHVHTLRAAIRTLCMHKTTSNFSLESIESY